MRNDLSAQVKADLVNFSSAIDGQGYLLLGESTMGDVPTRVYFYDSASTATADGENVLAATGMGGTGRFHKNQTASIKKVETFAGTTNSSGNYTISFGTAYAATPNIQANLIGGTNTNLIKITSVSTTGFTVNVVNRTDVVGLLPSYANVNGASVQALITEA